MAVGGSIWLLAISAGMGWWIVHDRTPGASAATGNSWPSNASMVLSEQTGTVIMFVHPHCPCTRASLAKLDSALAACAQKPRVYVVVSPIERDASKTLASANYRRAEQITGAVCIIDDDRRAQARFGAATSGQVVYFDSRGDLKFSGGLTAERGGMAPGGVEQQFVAAVRDTAPSLVLAPVFGCPL